MSRLKRLAIGCAVLAACAARATESETPRCAGVVPRVLSPDAEPVVVGADPAAASEPPLADVDHAVLRDWLAPVMSLEMSSCPRAPSPEYFACWCRLVCGVRLQPRHAKISVRWPYADVDGPGFAVAPDGTIEECWQTQVGQTAETHVRCAVAR
ncbi:MAG TPA: hypothetical protein VKQ32_29990 [Polyangia bacterium]|nr:hypothetical protein [Polyangia bacterium]